MVGTKNKMVFLSIGLLCSAMHAEESKFFIDGRQYAFTGTSIKPFDDTSHTLHYEYTNKQWRRGLSYSEAGTAGVGVIGIPSSILMATYYLAQGETTSAILALAGGMCSAGVGFGSARNFSEKAATGMAVTTLAATIGAAYLGYKVGRLREVARK